MTTQTLIVTISLPFTAQAIHAKGYWRAKTAPTKAHRQEVKYLTMQAISKAGLSVPVKRIRVSSEWFMARTPITKDRYRPLDSQNALGSLKAAFDGLVDAGLIESDGHKFLEIGTVKLNRSAKEHKGRCAVDLVIEVIEP